MFDTQPDFQFLAVPGEKSERAVLYPREKARRDAIKAAGGAEYEALLAKECAARAKFRKNNPERLKELRRKHKPDKKEFRSNLCHRARNRARKRGLDATITVADLDWPTHCPVLGIALDYPDRYGERQTSIASANWPSLDRWDPAKGYVPGNVFVISYRANTLKNNATYAEILKVAKYLSKRPR